MLLLILSLLIIYFLNGAVTEVDKTVLFFSRETQALSQMLDDKQKEIKEL